MNKQISFSALSDELAQVKTKKFFESDKATSCEVIDNRAFSEFCGVESSNQVPDGDTIGKFRNILVHNGLEQEIFAQASQIEPSIG